MVMAGPGGGPPGRSAGAGRAVPSASLGTPVITGLASAATTGYFTDQYGNPRLLLADNPWAICCNAGRWNSGNWQAVFDGYCNARGGQGFTAIYTDPLGNTEIGGLHNGGLTWDSVAPFNSGGDPSTGLNGTFWTRIDYLLAAAARNGITVILNIGYDGGANTDMDTGGALFSLTSTQYQDWGSSLAARYKTTRNIIWAVGNDYFGNFDTAYTNILAGLRAGGDSHVITAHNYAESDSRFDFGSGTAGTVLPWGTSNTQFNGVYTYNAGYYGLEYAYTEASPVTTIWLDGYFYQGGSAYDATLDRAMRQEAWWTLASGARGLNTGSESIWPWPVTAAAAAASDWWYVNSAGKIRTAVETLAGWWKLIPDTSSALVTGGRGTRVSSFTSGGSGGQYEPAFTNSYVAASRVPDGSLALLYLPNHTTITIDQAKMAAGYTARWIDPVNGTMTSATAGATYNSTARGTNSQGDPDWALALAG